MLFRKGKNGNNLAVSGETPRPPRYTSLALISVNGFEGHAVLRNVSAGGFCMESKTFADMDVYTAYAIRIVPETFAGISQIGLTVEVRWILSSPDRFSVGFKVVQGNNYTFEKYVGFLKGQYERQAG